MLSGNYVIFVLLDTDGSVICRSLGFSLQFRDWFLRQNLWWDSSIF